VQETVPGDSLTHRYRTLPYRAGLKPLDAQRGPLRCGCPTTRDPVSCLLFPDEVAPPPTSVVLPLVF
jgi:hypothetical protein